MSSSSATHPAGLAFDSIAEQYDDLFTRSLIGRAQRAAVWDVLQHTFRAGERILELNCGTGEDALFLSRMGISVFACDASERMIAVAARRMATAARGAQVQLEILPIERILELGGQAPFDGAFSNFSGLNCVADLAEVASQLGSLIKPRGSLVMCLSSRVCLWETLWYLAHWQPAQASRRWVGFTNATLGQVAITVYYPTLRKIKELLAPFFTLRFRKGIGVSVPPSYVEHMARRYPRLLNRLEGIDRVISKWPILRGMGDHALLIFERTNA